jgi:hypothetical protein
MSPAVSWSQFGRVIGRCLVRIQEHHLLVICHYSGRYLPLLGQHSGAWQYVWNIHGRCMVAIRWRP